MKKIVAIVCSFLLVFGFQLSLNAHAKSTSTELTLGHEVTNYITDTVDTQYYHVTLTQPGELTVKVSSYIENLNVDVYDDKNKEIMSTWDFSGADSVNPIPWTGTEYLEAGTYTIKVNGDSDNTGKYNLNTSFTPSNNNEIEPNNGGDIAQAIKPNLDEITGLISWNDDADYYKVKLEKAGLLSLYVSSYVEELNVNIYDADNNQIMENWDFSDASRTNSIPWTGKEYLEAGTYIIKVAKNSDYTGKYILKTSFTEAGNNEIEPNNGTDLAQNLEPNSNKITGLISWNDDADYYKVKLEKTGELSLNVSSYVEELNVNVYDENNNAIMENWDFSNASSTNAISWTGKENLMAGTYIIKISKDSDYTGKYTLSTSFKNNPPKAPKVNKVKKGVSKITGKTEKNSQVTVKIGNKNYRAQSNSTGSFTIKVPKLKAKTKLYVIVKTTEGTSLPKIIVVK